MAEKKESDKKMIGQMVFHAWLLTSATIALAAVPVGCFLCSNGGDMRYAISCLSVGILFGLWAITIQMKIYNDEN